MQVVKLPIHSWFPRDEPITTRSCSRDCMVIWGINSMVTPAIHLSMLVAC